MLGAEDILIIFGTGVIIVIFGNIFYKAILEFLEGYKEGKTKKEP
jgi:hypothetical protein